VCKLLFIFVFSYGLIANACRANAQPYLAHLVFEGGGIRGIAYTGALEVLEEAGLLKDVESAAGTSVGGLVAVLYAVGYSPRELMNVLADLKIQRFNDGRWMFIGGAARMSRRYGWYRGERFENWVAELIEAKTGKRDLTFRDLHRLREKNARFKDPTVFATDLSMQRSIYFSHETVPEMTIHLAVRSSMSVPLYFGAVFLDSAMQPVRKPKKGTSYHVLVDGGLGNNYPINFYNSGPHGDRRVLGLRLERPEQIEAGPPTTAGLAPYPIRNFRDYMGALYNFAIEGMNADGTVAGHGRTMHISTEGVGPRVRRLGKEDVELLVESGRRAARTFLARQKPQQKQP
jgi:NTE family protein